MKAQNNLPVQPEEGSLLDSFVSNRGVTRRSVLKWLGLGTGAAVLAGGGGAFGYVQAMKLPRRQAARIRPARIVIAGGGAAGISVAARILRGVPEANITIIEPNTEHHYQPGYTLVGIGIYEPSQIALSQEKLTPEGVRWVRDRISSFSPEKNRVVTAGGETLEYDALVIALGVQTDYSKIEGLQNAVESGHVSHIYNVESGARYAERVRNFEGGTAVFTFPQGYVKCGGAPQKICWLSEDLWRRAGKREKMDIHFHLPAPILFAPVPVISEVVTPMIEARGIQNHYRQILRAIDPSTRTAIFEQMRSHPDGSPAASSEYRIRYDFLHAMPTFTTPLPLAQSELTTPTLQGQVEVDRHTLQHPRFPNIFALGDCAGTGAAKTAATIRKQAPVLVNNLFAHLLDEPPSHQYDGTSGCPLLTRIGRCMMFEFDYDRNLRYEFLYQSTRETRFWWNFKLHGLPVLYRDIMLRGLV